MGLLLQAESLSRPPPRKDMDAQVYWIARGALTALPDGQILDSVAERELMERQGYVKVTVSPAGTAVKWAVFAANWSSLYFAMEFVATFAGPYRLQYYLAGWFEEEIADAIAARDRIHAILGKSDIHLTSRTFVKDADPDRSEMPPLLREALDKGRADPEHSVDCAYDARTGKFAVRRVGTRSEIARLWGMSPVSYPCITGHSYDYIVSQAYRKVIADCQPHYDHVCAAMTQPNSSVLWCTYQRVILPHKFTDGKKGVSILSKEANVDIRIV